jgi:hypothetical protein
MKGISVGRAHAGPMIRRRAGATSAVVPLGTTEDAAPLVLDSLTDFEEFFACLYPSMRQHSWLIDGAVFAFPEREAAAFESEVLVAHLECRLMRAGFLERWARCLTDDWCDIIGFPALPGDQDALVRACAGQPKERMLAEAPGADLAFFCIDGMYWEFYARAEPLLEVVREHLSSRQDLRLRDVCLEE